MHKTVYLSIGSNLGDRAANLREAIQNSRLARIGASGPKAVQAGASPEEALLETIRAGYRGGCLRRTTPPALACVASPYVRSRAAIHITRARRGAPDRAILPAARPLSGR